MLDKKELNVMELNNVSGGNWLNEVGDFFEDVAGGAEILGHIFRARLTGKEFLT